MAKYREETIKLADYADRDEHVGTIIEFDPDEFITVLPYGTLPKDIVLEIVEAFRGIDTTPEKQTPEAQDARDALRYKRNAMLITKWNVTDPSGKLYTGKPQASDFSELSKDIEHAIDRAVMSAFTTPRAKREEAGEG